MLMQLGPMVIHQWTCYMLQRRYEKLGEPYTSCKNESLKDEEILYNKNYSVKVYYFDMMT